MLALTVATNLALLAVMKYSNFAVANMNAALASIGVMGLPPTAIALPLGISFFTFHAVSYVVDVHRGDAEPQRNPLDLAVYFLMFPHLIAGPIVRWHHVARQIVARSVDRDEVALGVRRFIVGLGKKTLIANTLAVPADAIFALPPTELTRGDGLARGPLLHAADLLRLLRLLRHGDRARAHARVHVPRELRLPLHVAIDPRVLAALAHLTLELVP